MPKPVFIICCEGVLQDKTTNNLSIFKVLEKVIVKKGITVDPASPMARPYAAGSGYPGFEGVAVWRKEAQDVGKTFFHKFHIEHPDAVAVVEEQTFQFTEAGELSRFILVLSGIPIPEKSGVVLVKSQVREDGSTEWNSQDYPIFFDIIDKPSETVGESTQP